MEPFGLRSLNERIGLGSDSAVAPGTSATTTLHAALRSAYNRVGAPVGASISADIAGVGDGVTSVLGDLGDASGSTLGSVYAILGNPAETFLAKLGTTAGGASESGALLERLKYYGSSIAKGAATQAAAGKSILDAIGHDGTNILASGLVSGILGDPSGGTLTTLAARIGDNSSSRSLHALIGNDSVGLHAKVGDNADASTDDTIFGLIGQPGDASVNPGSEGSLYSVIRGVYDAIAAPPKKSTFTANIAQQTAAGGLTGNPTVAFNGSFTETGTDYSADTCIQYSITIDAPDTGTKTVDSCDVALHWEMKLNGTPGTVESKWAVVSGSSATVTGMTDLTDEVSTASATYVEYNRSGQIKVVDMDTLPFTLMLLAKKSGSATSAEVGVGSDSNIEVTYYVS